VQSQLDARRQRRRLVRLAPDLVHGSPQQVEAALVAVRRQQRARQRDGRAVEQAAGAAHDADHLAAAVAAREEVVQACGGKAGGAVAGMGWVVEKGVEMGSMQ
jgi:hypothetical protein